jgi:hypothetical protein
MTLANPVERRQGFSNPLGKDKPIDLFGHCCLVRDHLDVDAALRGAD